MDCRPSRRLWCWTDCWFAYALSSHSPSLFASMGRYGLTRHAASIAIAGHLADKSNSRRATYMLGLAALAVSTVMYSVGRSVAVLVVARSIQGASSAFVHCVGVVSEESNLLSTVPTVPTIQADLTVSRFYPMLWGRTAWDKPWAS